MANRLDESAHHLPGRGLWELLFGLTRPVGPGSYVAVGTVLMAFKYGVEAAVVRATTGAVLTPWAFVNPSIESRTLLLQGAPEWVGWAMVIWSLPFLWIALSMSVRRAADAGTSPWLGLGVLLPLVNLALMLMLCVLPHKPPWPADADAPKPAAPWWPHVVRGLALSLVVGGLMIWISVYGLGGYGAALFLGTPMVMSATASYVANRAAPRSYGWAGAIGLLSMICGVAALSLFALEGVICIAMAMPLLAPIGAAGGLLGKAIADANRAPRRYETVSVIACLPLWAAAETYMVPAPEYEVLSSVLIEAPCETVWEHVIEFPEITDRPAWYFRAGIAAPLRARIVGRGVGATRYCEFTTGQFVEPITAWEAPRRLAFDVVQQPHPMFEVGLYGDIHPPHLDGYLRASRGEFRLIALPEGRTLLEGRTWYSVNMFPQSYWTLWCNALIHRIHLRVLRHIERVSEQAHQRRRATAAESSEAHGGEAAVHIDARAG